MMSKILDTLRVVLIVAIISMLGYKYYNSNDFHIELNKYLQITIFVLMAVEAYRLFGPKGKEEGD